MVNPLTYIRRLAALLVLSGSLNIILIALLFYWNIRERPPTPYFELKPASAHEQKAPLAVDKSDSEVIRYFRRMPMEWLVSRLGNTQLVENGFTQRDLALASLVTFHHFDIERALGGTTAHQQKRLVSYGKFRDGTPAELIIYPGLSDKYFEAIVAFASKERWPLTSKGLFMALQKEEKGNRDPSLLDVFMMTPEFTSVERLFGRNVVPVDKDELLSVVLEGEWAHLEKFVQQQKAVQDLSPARRQSFLLDYVQHKSKAAAYLLLKTDGEFSARKLDDNQVLQLLQVLDEKSLEAEQFAVTVMTSPRSDAVLKMAAMRLYGYAGEIMPENYKHAAALSRFAPGYAGSVHIVSAQAPVIAQIPVVIQNKAVTRPQAVNQTKPVVVPAAPSPKPKPTVVSAPKPPVPAKPQAKVHLPKPATPPVAVATASRKLTAAVAPKPRTRFYVVQPGDSLWKISRKFNVDMEVIRAFNQLDSDVLRPGSTLKIP